MRHALPEPYEQACRVDTVACSPSAGDTPPRRHVRHAWAGGDPGGRAAQGPPAECHPSRVRPAPRRHETISLNTISEISGSDMPRNGRRTRTERTRSVSRAGSVRHCSWRSRACEPTWSLATACSSRGPAARRLPALIERLRRCGGRGHCGPPEDRRVPATWPVRARDYPAGVSPARALPGIIEAPTRKRRSRCQIVNGRSMSAAWSRSRCWPNWMGSKPRSSRPRRSCTAACPMRLPCTASWTGSSRSGCALWRSAGCPRSNADREPVTPDAGARGPPGYRRG